MTVPYMDYLLPQNKICSHVVWWPTWILWFLVNPCQQDNCDNMFVINLGFRIQLSTLSLSKPIVTYGHRPFFIISSYLLMTARQFYLRKLYFHKTFLFHLQIFVSIFFFSNTSQELEIATHDSTAYGLSFTTKQKKFGHVVWRPSWILRFLVIPCQQDNCQNMITINLGFSIQLGTLALWKSIVTH